jgi:hypothetical protein
MFGMVKAEITLTTEMAGGGVESIILLLSHLCSILHPPPLTQPQETGKIKSVEKTACRRFLLIYCMVLRE